MTSPQEAFDTHDQINAVVEQLALANLQFLKAMQDNHLAIVAALEQLARAISAPRRLLTDAHGNPLGSEPIHQ